jgi:hypothetical protein
MPTKPGCGDSLPISILTLPKLTPPLENVPYALNGHATGSESFSERSRIIFSGSSELIMM